MGPEERIYICIDLKSFYASVECVARGLDPLQALLLVADESRSDQTICLAVSPSLKAMGVPSRPRLFEAKQAIQRYEWKHHTKVDYIIAMPRMAEYERVSALIYSIYLRYVSEVDIHVYSIDECFLDVTSYLHLYQKEATAAGTNPARIMAMTMIKDVLRTTGITATVGIGTNLYLAKVAMDIVAKKAPADKDGVRIAELNEDSYKYLLWDHKPLTDFWQIGPGKQRRLEKAFLHTMGEIAQMSQWNEEFFFKTFGIDGEILIDHAWGIEPVTMEDIKAYKTEKHSVSNGQVLPRPYEYAEARVVFSEMVEVLCTELFAKRLIAKTCTWWVSYDYKSLEHCPGYDGPISMDYYGRLHPRHNNGTVKLPGATNSIQVITEAMLKQFDARTDHRLLYRRLGVCANDVSSDDGAYQTSLFLDYEKLDRENNLRGAMQAVRQRYGANALFRGMNLLEGATALERNQQIGGHRR
ncbi:MAG: DNA methylase [Lachnospiraceae bacterium]|nr:DNA methylase [Lachnospiraceae bacterium]